jgi:hypothetical protein
VERPRHPERVRDITGASMYHANTYVRRHDGEHDVARERDRDHQRRAGADGVHGVLKMTR